MMGRADLDGAEMDAISLDAVLSAQPTWDFPKIRGTLFWGPYHRDTII